MRKTTVTWIVFALFALVHQKSIAGNDSVPKHLELAREVVENIKPENNKYSNAKRHLRLPSDFLSSGYTVHTDCLGFVEEILYRSYNFRSEFSTRKYKDRYSIIDFVDSVDRGESLVKISRINDLKPGDFIAWKFLKAKRPGQTANGHIVTVDVAPIQVRNDRRGWAGGLTKWEVRIIDTSSGPASADDTRYVEGVTAEQADNALLDQRNEMKLTGVGRGKFFVYTDDGGAIRAMSYGFSRAKTNVQDDDWRIVMARPPMQ